MSLKVKFNSTGFGHSLVILYRNFDYPIALVALLRVLCRYIVRHFTSHVVRLWIFPTSKASRLLGKKFKRQYKYLASNTLLNLTLFSPTYLSISKDRGGSAHCAPPPQISWGWGSIYFWKLSIVEQFTIFMKFGYLEP